jgi:acid stress-induced BolA-like protein IbaG/YrbA
MGLEMFDPGTDVASRIKAAIESAISDAVVEVKTGSHGHFEIDVTSAAFAGQSMVKQQQLVYAAIKDLMAGDNAPVHAVDRLRTITKA